MKEGNKGFTNDSHKKKKRPGDSPLNQSNNKWHKLTCRLSWLYTKILRN